MSNHTMNVLIADGLMLGTAAKDKPTIRSDMEIRTGFTAGTRFNGR